MTLWLFNVAWWRAVQLLSFQTLTGSIYCDINWTFPISDYQPAYLKLLQDSTLDSWLMLLKQTDYLLMPSSKQNHHSNQVQFHCDNLSILIDSLLQEQLDNLRWVVFYSILLYVITSMLCFPWHEKVYLCGALWWCFCSSVYFSMISLTWLIYIKSVWFLKILQLLLLAPFMWTKYASCNNRSTLLTSSHRSSLLISA